MRIVYKSDQFYVKCVFKKEIREKKIKTIIFLKVFELFIVKKVKRILMCNHKYAQFLVNKANVIKHPFTNILTYKSCLF